MSNENIVKHDSVFISHIGDEAPVALELKRQLQQVLGEDVPVFVSSDYESIRSGEEWYQRIVNSITTSKVVIVLISRESVARPWINFEAGVGIGSTGKVFPIAIRGFSIGDLRPPLQALHARDIHDPSSLVAIIRDVGESIQRTPSQFDSVTFVNRINEIENRLSYKGIVLTPLVSTTWHDAAEISFELSNTGNLDLELIEIEVFIPRSLISPSSPQTYDANYIDTRTVNEGGVNYYRMTYKNYQGPPNIYFGITEPLPIVFTTSMAPRVFKHFRTRIRTELSNAERSMTIRYQVHVRNFKTEMIELSVARLLSTTKN